MTPSDRPEFARIPFIASCIITTETRRRTGFVCNLSQLGLYVQLDPPPEGDVSIRFALPDGGAAVEATAVVTWINDEPPQKPYDLPVGFGLRFVSLAPDDRGRIRALVEEYFRERRADRELSPGPTRRIRVPFVTPCSVVGGFGIASGTTCNLSTLGIYAAVERVPDVGETVDVGLTLPGRAEPFECKGVVTWQNLDPPKDSGGLPPGCGVRFERLREADAETIAQLVAECLDELARSDSVL